MPVYGALPEFRRCLVSILEHTDLSKHRLVIVDDGNSERELLSYFASLPKRHRQLDSATLTVLHNSRNRGFTASVNRGIAATTGDVIVLNSDTIVTAGWVEKMLAAANAPDVASVSPLSNSGSLYSEPYRFPRNLTTQAQVDAVARSVESCALPLHPEIPTPTGFCMLLKRSALDKVGLFDEVAFDRGYGEENDWAMRAVQGGYRHLLDDATFIHHTGHSSFTPRERRRLTRRANTVLRHRWPSYLNAVAAFQEQQTTRQPARLLHWLENNRPLGNRTILFVIHRRPFRQYGGIDNHVLDLATHLPDRGWNIAFLFPEHNSWVLNWPLKGKHRELVLLRRKGDREPAASTIKTEEFETVLSLACRVTSASIIHSHSLIGLPRRALLAARAPLLLSLHDLHFFCQRYDLIEPKTGEFCGFSRDLERCRACLASSPPAPTTDQRSWRSESRELLRRSAQVIVPSPWMMRRLQSELQVPRHPQVIPHGLPELHGPRPKRSLDAHGRIRVTFLGSFCRAKGSDIFASVVNLVGENRRVAWSIHGPITDADSLEVARSCQPIHLSGPYDRLTLRQSLSRKYDLVLFLSRTPETYCYALTEALEAGLAVIAFDLGAIGERLANLGKKDFLVPPEAGPRGVAEAVEKFLRSELLWAPPRSIEDTLARMLTEHIRLYEALSPPAPKKTL